MGVYANNFGIYKKPNSVILPRSSYRFMKEKREVFVEQVRALQIPTYYLG